MEKKFNMEWKIFSMKWKWKKIASTGIEYRKIVFHSIPYRAGRQHKSNKIAYKVNLPVFFTLNTISCFILSKDVEAEAVEAVKFLWKRKHVGKRDWKRTRKHKTSRARSGSIKNLIASTSLT